MNLRSIRFMVEYALARLALGVIPRLPRPIVVRMANGLGSIAARCLRAERRVARANLDLVFGNSKSAGEKDVIIRRSFQTFALTLLDLFWFARNTDNRVREWVSFDKAFERAFFPGAQVCVTAHMGSWEMHGLAFAMRGYPLTCVAATLANRRLDGLFLNLRKRTGQHILAKQGAIRGLLRTLKDGGKIAVVMDQNTKPSDGGIFVNFFGLPVPVTTTPAALSIRVGAEVLIGVCIADERGRYHVPAPSGIKVMPEMDESTLTATMTGEMEALVRAHPEHWLWMYKRWKYIAPWRAAEEYPFYAKQISQKDRAAILNAQRNTRTLGILPASKKEPRHGADS